MTSTAALRSASTFALVSPFGAAACSAEISWPAIADSAKQSPLGAASMTMNPMLAR